MMEMDKKAEPIFVFKHNVLLDAFRPPLKNTKENSGFFRENFKKWQSSIFVVNSLIHLRAEFPSRHFGITSKQVWDTFENKFLEASPSDKRKELLTIFKDCIDVIDRPSVIKVSLDDSLFVISDTLFSTSRYVPLLVSNVKDEQKNAEKFYNAKGSKVFVPFRILSAVEAEQYLRELYPEQSSLIDKHDAFKR